MVTTGHIRGVSKIVENEMKAGLPKKNGSIWTMGELLVEIMRPEPDMPLSEPGIFRGPFPSGAPAIFIDTVARLGYPAGIIGGTGRDAFGSCIVDRLKHDGVDTGRVEKHDESTGTAFVSYNARGDRSFIFHIAGSAAVRARFRTEKPAGFDESDRPAFFHVMGCSLMADERLRRGIIEAVEYFSEAGTKISFDPNIRPELLKGREIGDVVSPVLERTSVLLPGLPELFLLTGENDPSSAAEKLVATGIEVVAVKEGRKGATVFESGRDGSSRKSKVPAYPVDEIDPTGAGDAFDAGFLCGILAGYSYERCARVAARAGGVNAAAFGPMEGKIGPEIMNE